MAIRAIRSARVVLPDGVRPAALHLRDGRIEAVRPHDDWPQLLGRDGIDAGDLVVLPGLVDTHVHINDPGRADWEGFEHATRAAAAGGITTLVDMPLNSIPPTTSVAGFEAKQRAASGRCHVDVGFWGGVVPGNGDDLPALAERGVFGFKCFLAPSGVPEFGHVDETDLRLALPVIARLGLPLLVHAELPAALRPPAGDPRRYSTWLESRPAAAEVAAIDLMIRLARESGIRVHIVHLSTPEALGSLGAARADGVPITVETCPHYLTFAAEDIADGLTAFKCAPPIRRAADRESLWRALATGAIDFVVTDHSPAPPALKALDSGDFVEAWGGVASLQVALPVVWTGARARGHDVRDLVRWMAEGPATLAGLSHRKGAIRPGCDADLVVFDPDAVTRADPAALYSRHAVTPYAGHVLQGRVMTTILRGEVIHEAGVGPRATALGRLLSRVV